MARTDTLGHFLTDVADAIREKKGTSETITASNFDTEITNLPSGGGLDWSAIGYEGIPQSIIDGYDHAKDIYDNWDSSVIDLTRKFTIDTNLVFMPLVDTSNATKMSYMFNNCTHLITIPALNTSNVKDMSSMFYGCKNLTTIPVLDTSNVTEITGMFSSCTDLTTIPVLNTSSIIYMRNMFSSCYKLTDTSLDNILQMCINATSYNQTKTLAFLGISSSTYYPTTRIEALPHYQDFVDAGWTIGY